MKSFAIIAAVLGSCFFSVIAQSPLNLDITAENGVYQVKNVDVAKFVPGDLFLGWSEEAASNKTYLQAVAKAKTEVRAELAKKCTGGHQLVGLEIKNYNGDADPMVFESYLSMSIVCK